MEKSQAGRLPLVLLLDDVPPLAAEKGHRHASSQPSRKSSFSRFASPAPAGLALRAVQFAQATTRHLPLVVLGRLVPGWAQVAVMGMMIAQSGPLQWGMKLQSCFQTTQSAKTHALEKVSTPPEKPRLGNFLEGLGRLRETPFSSLESATGYGIRVQEIALGRGEFCNGDPVNNFDPDGRFGTLPMFTLFPQQAIQQATYVAPFAIMGASYAAGPVVGVPVTMTSASVSMQNRMP